MTADDLPVLVRGLALETKAYFAETLNGMRATIDALELQVKALQDRAPIVGPAGEPGPPGRDGVGERGPEGQPGRDGASVTVADVAPLILAEVKNAVAVAVAALPPPLAGERGQDGTSVTAEDVRPWLQAEVRQAVGALPPAQNGRDGLSVTLAEVVPLVTAEVQRAVAAIPSAPPGPAGKDGASVTLDDVAPLVAKAVALIPRPADGQHGKDGASVTVDDVRPLLRAEVKDAVAALPPPQAGRDGIGVVGALIDRDGRLILTTSDGATKDCGVVVGAPGRNVDPADVAELVTKELAAWPRPKDGKDGADGLGFDGADLVFDEATGYAFTVTAGERSKSWPVPWPDYRGVWKYGAYQKGWSCTKDGNLFIALEPTGAGDQPGQSPKWRLAVRRGQDGKDAKRAD